MPTSNEGYRFRLIDLLALMTVIAVLLGFLVPSLHNGRGGARRVECAVRLGELVKAMQMFELANNRYPGYLEAFGKDASGSCKVGTWAVALFPYVEQEPLYDWWQDPSTTPAWNANGGLSSTQRSRDFYPSISLFRCASDAVSVEKFGPNSFACNAGFFPDTLPPSYAGMDAHAIAQRSSDPTNGVFSNQLPLTLTTCYTGGDPMPILGSRANQPTRSNDIKDGLTQTIACSENLQADSWGYVGKPRNWTRTAVGSTVYAGDDLDPVASPRVHTGLVWLNRAQPSINGVAKVQTTNKFNGNRYTIKTIDQECARPSSGHTGLVNVAMLGGSVSSMSEDIDYVVYQALMTPRTHLSDIPDKTYKLKEQDYNW